MAHWAEIDQNNIVSRVIVVDNNDPNGDEGYQWLMDSLGGTWIQTSYNTYGGVHTGGGTPLRKNYAGVGFTYDSLRDAFIPPKPYPSWILDDATCLWDAPTPHPDDLENKYVWEEDSQSWVIVNGS